VILSEEEISMDLNAIKESIVTKVYHVNSDTKVPLHNHADKDEIFYCMKGSGYGVLEGKEVELTVGTKHSLRSDGDLYVSSFLVPVLKE